MLTKTKTFFNEVKVELQKCSWPWDPKEKGFKKYKELFDSTGVVIVSMLLLGEFQARRHIPPGAGENKDLLQRRTMVGWGCRQDS